MEIKIWVAMKCYCCKKELKRGKRIYDYAKKKWGVLCRSCDKMPILVFKAEYGKNEYKGVKNDRKII